jgi:hypothetical protein
LWTSHGCITYTHSILWKCQKRLGNTLWCARS